MPEHFLYPWSNGRGLCPLLADPALWAGVFRDGEDRAAVKRTLKRVSRKGAIVRLDKTDDAAVGRAVLSLLESPTRRQELGRQMENWNGADWRGNVASALHKQVQARF